MGQAQAGDVFRIRDQVRVCLFELFRAAPAADGSSRASGQTGAAAAGLHHSHSNARSEQGLRPTPQLMATRDP